VQKKKKIVSYKRSDFFAFAFYGTRKGEKMSQPKSFFIKSHKKCNSLYISFSFSLSLSFFLSLSISLSLSHSLSLSLYFFLLLQPKLKKISLKTSNLFPYCNTKYNSRKNWGTIRFLNIGNTSLCLKL
jgi:hypothetical protein